LALTAPEEIQQDMIRNLPNSAGYSDSKGIFAARKAVMHETQKQGIKGVTLDDIYLGNGASELIVMATNALLDMATSCCCLARLSVVDRRSQPVGRYNSGALPVR
jgi:aspartate/methionine/tyrosine aminotransferase